jgi:hypothetical protein
MKLEQYFEAYDNTHALAGKSPDWSATRRRIQWNLARPVIELGARIVFLLACVALGWWGHPIGYLPALATLCFIPQYLGNLREQIASIRSLSDEGELQQLLFKEAQKRMAGAVLGLVYYTGLAVLFLGTSAVMAWLGKDFLPGLFAGLIIALLGTHALFFRLPRASREMAMLAPTATGANHRKETRDGN